MRLPAPALIKCGALLFFCYLTAFLVRQTPLLRENFGITQQYTVVFPLGVFLGVHSPQATRIMARLAHSKIIFTALLLALLGQYIFSPGVDAVSQTIPAKAFTMLIKPLHPLTLIAALAMVIFLLDHARHRSTFLTWQGNYSLEIYLLHLPFMVSYDFFLFRRPFIAFFFVYLLFICLLAAGLKSITERTNRTLLGPPAQARRTGNDE